MARRRPNRLLTDAFREIRNTRSRFLSIMVLAALAVCFLAGLRATAPDMKRTADLYFDQQELMDLHVLSTLGLTDDDVAALNGAEGIDRAEGAYTVDAIVELESNEYIVKVLSISPSGINAPRLTQGRMPQSADECLVEPLFLEETGYSLGDTITLNTGTGDYEDALAGQTFTIVGAADSPLYIGVERGTSSLGTGQVAAYLMLPEEAFSMDYYTDVYVLANGAAGLLCYSDEYEDAMDTLTDSLADLQAQREQARYDEVMDEADQALADAQQEYDDAKAEVDQELADARQELEDARQELDDGWAEYYDGVDTYHREIADAQQELADGEQELIDAKADLDQGEIDYADGKAELEQSWQDYYDGLAEFEQGQQDYEEALAEFQKGVAEYEDGLKQYEDGLAEYEDGEDEVDAGWAEYHAGVAALESQISAAADSATASIAAGQAHSQADSQATAQAEDAGKAAGSAAVSDMDPSNPDYAATYQAAYDAAYDSTYASVYDSVYGAAYSAAYDAAYDSVYNGILNSAEIQSAQAQLDDARAQLEDADAQLSSAWRKLREAKAELDDAKAEIDEGQAELDDAKATLDESQAELEDAYQQLLDGEQELVDARQELDDGWQEYYDGLDELEEGRQTLAQETADGQRELDDAYQELQDGEAEYADGVQEYQDGQAEAEQELADAQDEIDDARRELSQLETCEWYILGRNTNAGYASYGMDADRMGNLASVFPLIFFLVAALVCLTTMTRMVEEQRVTIGGMKALGFSKGAIAIKYVGYGFLASAVGSLLGLAVGLTLLPWIICNAWAIIYTVGEIQYGLEPVTSTVACLAAVGTVTLSALGACFSTLTAVPAQLMRPKSPPMGKRILLERITPLWRRLSFNYKVSLRNLFRYQKRFWMTVAGIGGCAALIVTAFGLRGSIFAVMDTQYDELYYYTAQVSLTSGASDDELEELAQTLDGSALVSDWLACRSETVSAETERYTVDAYLQVVPGQEELERFVNLRHRLNDEPVVLPDDGVVLTEKLATLLGVEAGDTFTLDGDQRVQVRVADVTEHYIQHYIYMTQAYYEQLMGEVPEDNVILMDYDDQAAGAQELDAQLIALDAVTSLSLIEDTRDTFTSSLESVDYAVILIIVCAAALAFVVLYNLTNINITERMRELATLKVLGFYDRELSAYVYRENVFLTIFGVALGLVMGKLLHQWLILTVEIDLLMFGRTIEPSSYLYAVVLTVIFSLLVNLSARRKLRKLDMVESLKTVE